MTNKVKLFVGFLALIALFSVYGVFNSLGGKSALVAVISMGSPLPVPDIDIDHDGLTNREESYWNTDFQTSDTDGDGFLDGEEVVSGHDPLIPGPNDIINNGNLTDKLSKLTLSGLYEGSLKPDNPNYDKSLNDMALAVMDDAAKSLNMEIDVNKLKVISSNNKNEETYLEEISGPFENLLRTYGNEMQNLQKYLELIGSSGFGDKDLITYFQNKEQEFQAIYDRAYSINVPRNLISAHAYFLHFIKNLQVANASITHGSNDPVKASAGLNVLGDELGNLLNLIDPFIGKVKSGNLNNSFFKSLMQ